MAWTATGCGFQLKGRSDVPDEFSPLRVNGVDWQMIEALTDILSQHGVSVTSDDSVAEILIVRSDFQKFVETVNNMGIATGHAYRYTVEYRITDSAGTLKAPDEIISKSASLRYEVGDDLEVEEEEGFLKQQMANEIAGRIIRQLHWL